MKKSITKSQQAYHPDKNLEFDDEWKRLSYRISQKLNQIFDTMKSCTEPQLNQNHTNDDNDNDNADDNQTESD